MSAGKRRALLIGDQERAPWHPLNPAKTALEQILADEFDLDASTDYDRFKDLAEGSYDLCISYTDCWDWALTDEQAAALMQYVSGGGGLLAVHNGISIQTRYELLQMAGGKFAEHPPYQPLKYVAAQPDHPLLDGVEDFALDEEPYLFEFDPYTPRDVFLEYEYEGRRYPAGWTHPYGLGRVVYVQPGHHAPSFEPPAYRRLLANAAKWAAVRENSAG